MLAGGGWPCPWLWEGESGAMAKAGLGPSFPGSLSCSCDLALPHCRVQSIRELP